MIEKKLKVKAITQEEIETAVELIDQYLNKYNDFEEERLMVDDSYFIIRRANKTITMYLHYSSVAYVPWYLSKVCIYSVDNKE